MENKPELILYIELATSLIGKPRRCGGNMFRHQIDTLGILFDYGYADPILLESSVIHDIIEDDPNFNIERIIKLPHGEDVLKLVLEVSRKPSQSKEDFLRGIQKNGSQRSKILKVADRISNMISLGQVNDVQFLKKYVLETSLYVYPIAEEVNGYMAKELKDLLSSRLDILAGE